MPLPSIGRRTSTPTPTTTNSNDASTKRRSSTARTAQRYSRAEVDELEGWLVRLNREGARPPRPVLSPRSNRFPTPLSPTSAGPTSPFSPGADVSRSSSLSASSPVQECPSARPSSSLEIGYTGAGLGILSSALPLKRRRSKSLADATAPEIGRANANASPVIGNSPKVIPEETPAETEETASCSNVTSKEYSRPTSTPLRRTSLRRLKRASLPAPLALSFPAADSNTDTDTYHDALPSHRIRLSIDEEESDSESDTNRNSSSDEIAPIEGYASRRDSKRQSRVGVSSSSASPTFASSPQIIEAHDPRLSLSLDLENTPRPHSSPSFPTPSTQTHIFSRHGMASPTNTFDSSASSAMSASHSTHSTGSTSTSTGGRHRLQARSPFASPRQDRYRGRFYDIGDDDDDAADTADLDLDLELDLDLDSADGSTSRRRVARKAERVTVAQALQELDAQLPPPQRARRASGKSFASLESGGASIRSGKTGSTSSSYRLQGGGAGEDALAQPRESVDSGASSSRSLKFFSRVAGNAAGKLSGAVAGASPNSSSQSFEKVQPFQQQQQQSVPSTRPRLQARDDRDHLTRPRARPRLTSTRSTSSLPAHPDELDDDEDEFEHRSLARRGDTSAVLEGDTSTKPDSRRASMSSLAQLSGLSNPASCPGGSGERTPPIFGSSTARTRVSLAVPAIPAFNRSQSADSVPRPSSTSSLPGPGGSMDYNAPPHLRDMHQVVLLWLPDDPAAATSSSSSSASSSAQQGASRTNHGKALTRVILNSVPVPGRKKLTKRDSAQVLHAGGLAAELEASEKGKGKESGKVVSLLPAGKWQRCQAMLTSAGVLSVHNTSDHSVLVSVPITSLQRTDVRQIDQSLLGRQRCLAIHAKGASLAVGSSSPVARFPSSPSAPEFGALAASQSAPLHHQLHKKRDRLVQVRESSPLQTIYLAFPNFVALHTWTSALFVHARPEIYPSLVDASKSRTDALEEEWPVSDEDTDPVGPPTGLSSPRSVKSPTGAWRQKALDEASVAHHEHVRIHRSISLEIIEARLYTPHREQAALPTTPSLSTLLSMTSAYPASAHSISLAHADVRRSESVASGSAASTASSDDHHASGAAQGVAISASPSLSLDHSLAVQQQHRPPARKVSADTTSSGGKDEREKSESRHLYCEVWLQGDVVARTAMKKAAHSAAWYERFTFSNLGLFTGPLSVHVSQVREKAITPLAKVDIPLSSVRRGQRTTEWYPVTSMERNSTGLPESCGEICLRLCVSEDTVFEHAAYARLEEILLADENASALRSLLSEPGIDMDDIVPHIVRMDIAHGRAVERLTSMTRSSLAEDAMSPSTLYRGNTPLTKAVEYYMRVLAADWLDTSLGDALRTICKDRVALEIDPARIEASSKQRPINEQVKGLQDCVDLVWSSIYNARHDCPSELRRLFRNIRHLTMQHFSSTAREMQSEPSYTKIRFTSISAFVFLRFFVPAILNPHLFRLCPAFPPDSKTQRTLLLIAKTLQGLANEATFGDKEPWMAVMNPFVQANVTSFEDFITHLCSVPTAAKLEWTSAEFEPYLPPMASRDRLDPSIVKQGIPTLPLGIDLPREYAAFAAVVSRFVLPRARVSDEGSPHAALVETCRQIFTSTRCRVQRLERQGHLSPSSGKMGQRHLMARSEIATRTNSTRQRGMTVSRATYAGSLHGSDLQMTPPRGIDRGGLAWSPTSSLSSQHSASPGEASRSLLGHVGSLSDSASRAKRRSYTITGPPTLPSPASSPTQHKPYPGSRRLPTPLPQGASPEILEIHLPSGTSLSSPPTIPASLPSSYRRTTVTARPKLPTTLSDSIIPDRNHPSTPLSSAALTHNLTSPEATTPRVSSHTYAATRTNPSILDLPLHSASFASGIEHELGFEHPPDSSNDGEKASWAHRR